MRISDWSSYVCSSDRNAIHLKPVRPEPVEGLFFLFKRRRREERCFDKLSTNGSEAGLLRHRRLDRRLALLARGIGFDRLQHAQHVDRKSAVQGKSVSVRVDLGGRGFFKKTTSRATH